MLKLWCNLDEISVEGFEIYPILNGRINIPEFFLDFITVYALLHGF